MLVARSFSLLLIAAAMTACTTKHELPADSSASTVSRSATSAGSPDDYGPSSDVSAVRAAWLKESSNTDTIPQIIVVNGYGVVEVRNGGPNSPFFALFQRDPSGSWQDKGLVTGQVGLCGLTTKIPDSTARAIVAHDKRLSANQRADPHAGCSGAI